MRIIAGKYKHITLNTLDSNLTRPTKDMVKEAMFSSLFEISGYTFLDLFAGSGAIGIEAISRGAKRVIFNDNNKDACKVIKNNLLKINEKCDVYNLDYDKCLKEVKDIKFDCIFLDPPYAFNEYDLIFNLINEYQLLNENGIVIVEVKNVVVLENEYKDIKIYKEKKYGISKLLYYKR